MSISGTVIGIVFKISLPHCRAKMLFIGISYLLIPSTRTQYLECHCIWSSLAPTWIRHWSRLGDSSGIHTDISWRVNPPMSHQHDSNFSSDGLSSHGGCSQYLTISTDLALGAQANIASIIHTHFVSVLVAHEQTSIPSAADHCCHNCYTVQGPRPSLPGNSSPWSSFDSLRNIKSSTSSRAQCQAICLYRDGRQLALQPHWTVIDISIYLCTSNKIS